MQFSLVFLALSFCVSAQSTRLVLRMFLDFPPEYECFKFQHQVVLYRNGIVSDKIIDYYYDSNKNGEWFIKENDAKYTAYQTGDTLTVRRRRFDYSKYTATGEWISINTYTLNNDICKYNGTFTHDYETTGASSLTRFDYYNDKNVKIGDFSLLCTKAFYLAIK